MWNCLDDGEGISIFMKMKKRKDGKEVNELSSQKP